MISGLFFMSLQRDGPSSVKNGGHEGTGAIFCMARPMLSVGQPDDGPDVWDPHV